MSRRSSRQLGAASRATTLALAASAVFFTTAALAQQTAAPSVMQRIGVEAAVTRLSSADPRVRRGAAYDIGRYLPASPRLATELSTALGRESDVSVILAVIDALVTSRQASVLIPYAQIIRSEFPPEATAAAMRGLHWSRDPMLAAIFQRINVFAAPPMVRDAAARALSTMPDGTIGRLAIQSRSQLPLAILVLRALGLRGDPRWSAFVIDQMRATSRDAVLAAIDAAVTLRLPEAPAELLELARDANDRAIRRAALRAIGALGDAGDGVVLRASLGDPLTRDAALDACAQLGDARFVDAIVPLLSASWSADRRAAADVLGAIGGGAAASALDRALAGETESTVRTALWQARARASRDDAWIARAMRDPAGRWAVVARALRGSDVRAALGTALRVTPHDPASAWLSGAYGEHERERVTALESHDARERLDAALSFVATRTIEADEALVARLTREDDEAVRVALVLALGVSGSELADAAIVSLLDRQGESRLPAVLAAVQMAGARRLRAAVDSIAAVLRATDDDPRARTIAVHALGRIADPRGAAAVEEVARFDADEETRGAALVAYALMRGGAAHDVIRATQRIAWSERLIDRADRAERIASGESADLPFRGASVVVVTDAEPGSIWSAILADGSARIGVAASDGTLILGSMPSTPVALHRLGGSR